MIVKQPPDPHEFDRDKDGIGLKNKEKTRMTSVIPEPTKLRIVNEQTSHC